jgi:hypothetical protein
MINPGFPPPGVVSFGSYSPFVFQYSDRFQFWAGELIFRKKQNRI